MSMSEKQVFVPKSVATYKDEHLDFWRGLHDRHHVKQTPFCPFCYVELMWEYADHSKDS